MKTLQSTLVKILFTVFVITLTLNVSCILDAFDDEGDNVSNLDYEAKESFTYQIPDIGFLALQVEAINGNIGVKAISQLDTILIRGERIVKSESLEDAQEQLQNLQVVIDQSTNLLIIRTEQPKQTNGRSFQVNYGIEIPAEWPQKLVQVNGNITSELSLGNVNITGTNGNIFVKDCISTVETVLANGNINILDVFGSVHASLTNGNIITKMSLSDGGVCNLENVNGIVQLAIPTTTSATFSASTVNGLVSISNLDLNNSQISQRHISGILGDGKGTIVLQTTNGNVSTSGY